MLNFGLKKSTSSEVIFPIISYNYKFNNVSGPDNDAVLNSSGFTDINTNIVLDVTNIDMVLYTTIPVALVVTDTSSMDTLELSNRLNNIMLFNRFLSQNERDDINDNPGLWDVNNTPDHLIEWYPCSENGTTIYDTLGTKSYDINGFDTVYNNEPYGIQSIGYDKDSNGTLKTFSIWPLININTTMDYLDTQWIPEADRDWSIEVEQEFNSNNNYNLSGIQVNSPDEERFFFGEITSNRPYIRLGDSTLIGTTLTDGFYKLTVVYDSNTKSADIYIDDVLLGSVTPTNYINNSNTFRLGWVDVGTGSITNYKNLKIYDRKIK